MAIIFREVLVLGVSPEMDIKDYSDKKKVDECREKKDWNGLPTFKGIVVYCLQDVDFEKSNDTVGYAGDLSLKRYEFAVKDNEALVKRFKPKERLLLKLEQVIYEKGENKGRVYEKILSADVLQKRA